MSVTRVGDISIKVGEYESDGKTKGEYEQIGQLMRADDGREFILLNNSALNPSLAMIANKDRRRRVAVAIFRDEAKTDSAPKTTGKPAPKGNDFQDDEIPF